MLQEGGLKYGSWCNDPVPGYEDWTSVTDEGGSRTSNEIIGVIYWPSNEWTNELYLWIEGQDIDSLETNSDGAELNVSINFIKDTAGYDAFD